MIEHLVIENFKIHRHFEPPRDFGRFNVLIGPNGVGKTSVFQAMELLCGLMQENLSKFIEERNWSYDDLPNLRDRSKSIQIKARIHLPADNANGALRVEYQVRIVPRRYLTIGDEKVTKLGSQGSGVLLSRKNREVNILDETRPSDPFASMQFLGASSAMSALNDPYDKVRYRTVLRLRRFLAGIRHYTIWSPEELRKGSKRLESQLARTGGNLPSVLAWLKENNPRGMTRLVKQLRSQFPWLSDVVARGQPGKRTFLVSVQHGRDTREYRPAQVSDGFLRMLALATMRYQGTMPTVLAFEEPENGVHPRLLQLQVKALHDLSSGARAPQLFLATHSPYALDYVPVDSVLVMTMDREGEVKVHTVNKDAPLLREGGLLPGEAWAYRSERALIGKSKRKSRDTDTPELPGLFDQQNR